MWAGTPECGQTGGNQYRQDGCFKLAIHYLQDEGFKVSASLGLQGCVDCNNESQRSPNATQNCARGRMVSGFDSRLVQSHLRNPIPPTSDLSIESLAAPRVTAGHSSGCCHGGTFNTRYWARVRVSRSRECDLQGCKGASFNAALFCHGVGFKRRASNPARPPWATLVSHRPWCRT